MAWSSPQYNDIVECGATLNSNTIFTARSSLISTTSSDITISYKSISRSRTSSCGSERLLPNGISSMPGVYYNFMNSLVGAGILGLPYVYPYAGLLGGFLLQFVFALLSIHTLIILIKAAQKLKVHDYEALGYKCFGNFGYVTVATCLFLQDFGSMTNYLIIIGDSSFKIASIYGYDTFANRQLTLLCVALLIIFPPCLLRDIAFYERFSFIKLVTIVLVIALIIYEYLSYRILETQSYGATPNKYMPPFSDLTLFNLAGFPRAVGIVAYTFEVHDAAFLYYNTLWNPTITRWTQLSSIGVTSAMMLGLLLSFPAYLIFGNHITSNVLDAFDLTQMAVIVARIIYGVTMALSYPTAFFVVRHVLYMSYQKMMFSIKEYREERKYKHIMYADAGKYNTGYVQNECTQRKRRTFEDSAYTIKTSPLLHHATVTIVLFAGNLLLSLYITNLGVALNLVGSIASINLIFILPASLYWKSSDFTYKFWQYETWQEKQEAFIAIYGSFALIIIGFFMTIIGIGSIFIP